MGYARLHFNTGNVATIGGVVRDIIGCIAGNITSTSQLITATPELSEIYNNNNRGNWTLIQPTPLPSSNATSWIPAVLTSTCLNGNLKHIRIGGCGTAGAITNTSLSNTYNYSSATTTQGVYLQSMTSFTNNVTIGTGNSWVNKGTSLGSINYITGPYVYVSWSSRHCLIAGSISGQVNADFGYSACFEHNETPIHDARNVAPFMHISHFADSYDTTQPITATSAQNLSSVIIFNHYRPDTTWANVAYNLHNRSGGTGINTVMPLTHGCYVQSFTKNSSGASAIYLQPMYWHDHGVGIPHHYISDLSKVYRTQYGIGNAGDTMTVGSNVYAYIPIGTTTALAVLRE